MAELSVPFITKMAILDSYIHSENPMNDPASVDVIVEFLQSNADLRNYFFNNKPHHAWIKILWDKGFFDNPPQPEQTNEGLRFKWWDVQNYLLSVVCEVPDYYLLHIEKLGQHPIYSAHAVQGLTKLPLEYIEKTMPYVIQCLSEYAIAKSMEYGAIWDVFFRLADEHRNTAFILFDALIRPFANPRIVRQEERGYNDEAVAAIDAWRYKQDEFKSRFELLKQTDCQRLVEISETNLRLALQLEEDTRSSYLDQGWWRSAIEVSGQNYHHHHKDYLLDFLRDATEFWMQNNPLLSKSLLERYLGEESIILQRLGIHLLRVNCKVFMELTETELLEKANFDDSLIHHEFLLLLQNGFTALSEAGQKKVTDIILQGPPRDFTEQTYDERAESRGVSKEQYIKLYRDHWVLERLCLLKERLEKEGSTELRRLIDVYGEPEHPTFLMWSGGVGFVSQESPLTWEELIALSPDALLTFMRTWQPSSNFGLDLREISYEGLGNVVAHAFLADGEKYQHILVEAISLQPTFAYSYLRQAVEAAKSEALAEECWADLISVCESLLGNETIRNNQARSHSFSWREVRQTIVDLMEIALHRPNKQNANSQWNRVRDVLLLLLNDDDPNQEDDRPKEGWFGHNDPFIVAINHVRPKALIALIDYAISKAQDIASPTQRIEPEVLSALSEMLHDTSSAVHSVFGRYLMTLHWLDSQWVEDNLEIIFPLGDSEEERWAYVSAWDSYVIANHSLSLDLMKKLVPYYERAIENLRDGYVTKSHLQPVEGLASHLLLDYFLQWKNGNKRLSDTLIYCFFNQVNPKDRSQGASVIRNFFTEFDKDDTPVNQKWEAALELWRYRVQDAENQNYAPEFHDEINEFITLLEFAPESETLASMWSLLQGSIVYVCSGQFNYFAWDAAEKFLTRCASAEPDRAIRLLTQMYESASPHRWYSEEQTSLTRSILKATVSSGFARDATLNLIDYLARKSDFRFQDIYDQWVNS